LCFVGATKNGDQLKNMEQRAMDLDGLLCEIWVVGMFLDIVLI
jgi:hypothetical protein